MRRLTILLMTVLLFANIATAQTPKYPVGMLGKYTSEGMLVQRVLPDTPAERGGMTPGDLIYKVDGQLVTSQDEFVSLINSSGGSVVLIVRKSGTSRVVRVGLDLTGNRSGPPAPYFLGVLGSFGADGITIRIVGPGTPAARVGLAPGDTIGRINNRAVNTQAEFFDALYRSGGNVVLTVRKANGRIGRLEVDLNVYELGVVGEFSREGLVIAVVAPDTPAAFAGLQRGDLIQRIDNKVITSQGEFDAAINGSGGAVTLQVRRGGRVARTQVDLMNNQLGCWCEPNNDGLRITAIVPGSPAASANLARGDTILKLDDRRVRTTADLLTLLRHSSSLVTLTVRQARTERLVRVEVDLLR